MTRELPAERLVARTAWDQMVEPEAVPVDPGEPPDRIAVTTAYRRVEGETGSVPTHVQGVYEAACKGCRDAPQRAMMADLLRKYGDVFSKDSGDIGRTSLVEHSIPVVEGTRPIRQPPHRLGPHKEAEAERQVQELLKQGLIEPSTGAWSSPVVLVRKKDNSWRFCIDYRRLNAVTQQDAYPIPRIDESLDALAGSRHFSTLDLTSGYWQVPLDPDAQEKAAIRHP